MNKLNSADDITVRTYYKIKTCLGNNGCGLQDITVTDVSDLLVGGTVEARIGDTDAIITYDKNALFQYINYFGYYDTAQ